MIGMNSEQTSTNLIQTRTENRILEGIVAAYTAI